MKQRMGVVIVGPSGSGKSTVWKLLKIALVKRGQSVMEYAMNPKAMPRTKVSHCMCQCTWGVHVCVCGGGCMCGGCLCVGVPVCGGAGLTIVITCITTCSC